MKDLLNSTTLRKSKPVLVFLVIALAALSVVYRAIVWGVMSNVVTKLHMTVNISYCVSPTSNEIIFTGAGKGFRDLYSFDIKRKRVTRLTDTPQDEKDPAFSHDGQWLVYSAASQLEGTYHLYLQSVSTKITRQLTDSRRDSDASPVFSADDKSLIFVRTKDFGPPFFGGRGSDIYSLNRETGSTTQLTHTNFFGVNQISVSPDGINVVFSAGSRNQHQPNPHCFLLSLNNSFAMTELQDGAIDASDTPCFTIDGQSVTLSSDTRREYHYNLVRFNIHKPIQSQHLLTSGWYYSKPAYTSDGKALFCLKGYDKPTLIQMNADGSKPVEIASFKLFENPLGYH